MVFKSERSRLGLTLRMWKFYLFGFFLFQEVVLDFSFLSDASFAVDTGLRPVSAAVHSESHRAGTARPPLENLSIRSCTNVTAIIRSTFLVLGGVT